MSSAAERAISMDQLFEKHGKLGKNDLILDVRHPEEYASGHVPGARNISYEQVGHHAEALKKYDNVYLYCKMGGRVQAACHELESLGLKNLIPVVGGGMPNWISNGFPVE